MIRGEPWWIFLQLIRTVVIIDLVIIDIHDPSNIEWDLTNGPLMEVARAIWYSGLGVHSVGPVGDFLDMMIDMANVGGWTYSRFPAVITRIGSFCSESQMLFCMSDPKNPIYPIFPSKSESWWGPKTHPCHTNRFIHSPLTIYQVLLPSPFYVDGDVFVWL